VHPDRTGPLAEEHAEGPDEGDGKIHHARLLLRRVSAETLTETGETRDQRPMPSSAHTTGIGAGTGSEITFVGGTPRSLVVKEDRTS
jgi:hypothetical protein